MSEEGLESSSELPDIPRDTRKKIFDGIRLKNIDVFGRLNDVDFLERLYDLQNIPSQDPRYATAATDIRQHCVNYRDWDDHWFLNDTRFNLMSAPPKEFIQFLCEILHPAVRRNQDEVTNLLQHFNNHLNSHGWHLVKAEEDNEYPYYEGQIIQNHHHYFISRAHNVADVLDSVRMKNEINRIKNAIDSDPASAIGTAKDLLESCCKTILGRLGVSVSKSDDLPKLTKTLAKELKLVPDDISDRAKGADNIRLILRNLSALPKYIAELRGLYGSGHGRDGKHKELEPRHARLAVASAIAFIDFITETYRQHTESDNNAKTGEEEAS